MQKDETGDCCGMCRFWKFLYNDDGMTVGACMRYPPYHVVGGREDPCFPNTASTSWCGEFSRKEPK